MNDSSPIRYRNADHQKGFMVLMILMMLALGTAVWFGTLGEIRSNSMKLESEDRNLSQLKAIKDRMLAYAILHPEIYSDESVVSGVGYFPCPDTDNDGNPNEPCGYVSGTNQLYVIGRVPTRIANHFFSFIDSSVDSSRYWFAVDSRLVNSHSFYQFNSASRIPEINTTLTHEVKDLSNKDVPPLLVDGKDDIVMALFYAGAPLAGQSRPSNNIADYLEQPSSTLGYNINFQSIGVNPNTFNDYVITITRNEWEAAILSRVTQDTFPQDGTPDLCNSITDNTEHWFNECAYTNPVNRPIFACNGTALNNLGGQGWRNIVCP
ncbi:hypothetical protein QCB45_09425 [Thiomicrorhabdus sp. ZW0627]|uniref:hypothetical protein n=1 Tax=Thiomicrorhabdus sp. ZW0627 TaxID=3039774 RepID=UPI0024373425|nr:hypothetical protein [Thiomicrorhabdus sp. ZW0627]MDG6774552.1 hypothetical protein [Thiomicrorhabdus sp. ZW0627]